MVSFVDSEVSVTTWGKYQDESDGETYQMWKATDGKSSVFFTAPRNTEFLDLNTYARVLLGLPITENCADVLTAHGSWTEALKQ